MNKVRIGLVGIGVQGTSYARMLTNHTDSSKPVCPANAELAAYCDILPEALEKANQAFGELPSFSDYKEMIDSGKVDAVITTLPHFFHPEVTIYALEHGIHVLVEKPAAVDAKSVHKMNAVAEAHPELVFGIMLNQRTNQLYRDIKEIIDSGELGELRRSNWIINSWWRSTPYYNQSAWRATWGGEGGGVLVNQAPHQLDLWQWLCGVPKKVYAKMVFGAHREIVVENDVTMTVEYENGATGVFVTCTHDINGTDRLEIDFSKGKIVVENSREAKIYRFTQDEAVFDRSFTLSDMNKLLSSNRAGGGDLYSEESLSSDGRWGFQHIEVMQRFCDQITKGEGLLAHGSEGIMGVNLANAAFLSAWLNQEVELPVDQDLFLAELNKRIAEEGKFALREV